MFNIADMIVIIIIGLTAFLGYKKGFIKTGFGFLSFFIAIVLTFVFYKPVMNLIKENTGFENWLTEYLLNIDFKNKTENSIQESKEVETSYLSNLPDSVVELIGLDEIKENAKNIIVEKVVDFAVKLLAVVVVYIAVRILMLIAVNVLDIVAKLPVLKQFNEVLGLIVGIILGFIRVYVILTIITFLSSVSAFNGLTATINNSLIASFLYNNNLLLNLLF